MSRGGVEASLQREPASTPPFSSNHRAGEMKVGKGLFACSINGIELFLAEPDHRTNHVLIKMLHPGSSRNRQHGARAFEEPGECHLARLGGLPTAPPRS